MSNIVDPCQRARRTFVGRVSVTEMLITASRTRSAITSRVQNQPLTPGPFSPNLLRDNNNLSEDPGVFFSFLIEASRNDGHCSDSFSRHSVAERERIR